MLAADDVADQILDRRDHRAERQPLRAAQEQAPREIASQGRRKLVGDAQLARAGEAIARFARRNEI